MYARTDSLSLKLPVVAEREPLEFQVTFLEGSRGRVAVLSGFKNQDMSPGATSTFENLIKLISENNDLVILDLGGSNLRTGEITPSLVSLKRQNKSAVLVHPGETLLSGLKLQRMDQIVDIRENLQAALSEFAPSASPRSDAISLRNDIENSITARLGRESFENESFSDHWRPVKTPGAFLQVLKDRSDKIMVRCGSENGHFSEESSFLSETQENFRELIATIDVGNPQTVYLDLSPIRSIDGGATSAFISLKTQLDRIGAKLVLTGVPRPIRELIELQKLEGFFQIED